MQNEGRPMGLMASRSCLRLAPMLVLAACAAGGSPGSGDPANPPIAATTAGSGLAVIEVVHDDPANSSTVTLLITPIAGGVRSSLGSIRAGETKQFTYDAVPGNYRLSAQGGKNSATFRLSNREKVTWRMQTQRVQVTNK
jgi:hypothetical protein